MLGFQRTVNSSATAEGLDREPRNGRSHWHHFHQVLSHGRNLKHSTTLRLAIAALHGVVDHPASALNGFSVNPALRANCRKHVAWGLDISTHFITMSAIRIGLWRAMAAMES